MINNDLPEDAYRARDFLGWVYQFFNRDEKKQIRDENKGTPGVPTSFPSSTSSTPRPGW